MKKITAIFFVIKLIAIVYFLNIKIYNLPPLGKFLDPFHGFLKLVNSDKHVKTSYTFSKLNDNVEVVIDNNKIPHVFAKNEYDLFFTQGYLTAFDRLWQMEFQTHAAAGRLSEIIGSKAFDHDRYKRRIGMIFAAENGLIETKKYKNTYSSINAYADGVNAYINSLNWDEYPIEYKILDYKPEKWTTKKTLLFLKSMALTLSGRSLDLNNSQIKNQHGINVFNDLYPQYPNYIDPIIPKGTIFDKPSISIIPPDTAYRSKSYQNKILIQPDKSNGSNNWAVDGSKTKSGFTMLSNDPHLQLTLPNIWYQIHLNTPKFNVYGASLPGAPCVISGFNDSIAWGETNGGDDVWDWYDITFKDKNMNEYYFNGSWVKTKKRIEEIKIRGKKSFFDTVTYTHFGPIVWSNIEQNKYLGDGEEITNVGRALRWLAHDPSVEIKTFYELNKAKDYNEFVESLKYFTCPAQNFAYADVKGNIAMWHSGNTPVKWKNQGRFVMDGTINDNSWKKQIPHIEKPHIKNPESGYISSANQHVTDDTYPYYLGSQFVESYRGERINQKLTELYDAEINDFIKMQTDNKNIMAERVLPLLLDTLQNYLVKNEYSYALQELSQWNYFYDAEKVSPTIYNKWIDYIEKFIWQDNIGKLKNGFSWPDYSRLEQLLLKEHNSRWIDNIDTPQKEKFGTMVKETFDSTIVYLESKHGNISSKWTWGISRGTDIHHIAKIPGFGEMRIITGGGKLIPNATRKNNGPSWRYVVEMSRPPKAKGTIPGGQSGYPGSKFYVNMLENWKKGTLNDINSSSNINDISGQLVTFKNKK